MLLYYFLEATRNTLFRVTLLLGAIGGLRAGFVWWRHQPFRSVDHVLLSTYLVALAMSFFSSFTISLWHFLEIAATSELVRPLAILGITVLVYLLRSRLYRATSESDARQRLAVTYALSLTLLMLAILLTQSLRPLF